MIYLFLYLILIIILNLFNLSFFLIFNKIVIFIEFEFLKVSRIKLEYLILLDWVSVIFIIVVIIITFNVIIYRIEYMNNEIYIKRFIFIIMLFVIFILLIIIRPNILRILLGWDGLGLISYCLVIFYQNEVSYNSGIVTVLTNRVGDSIIIILIGLILINGSWNILYLFELNWLILIILIFVAFTKRAQIPFSAWLPKAIAAPTPVSSLVHSSTLVTAGVYLLIRFNYLFKINLILINIIIFISILTLFISRINANFEFDFKKIIALSTLRQLSIIIFRLSLGMEEISFFHLLIHAIFKCLLFICAGVIIHNIINNQDIRYIRIIFQNIPLISIIFNCSTFSLCGIPFISGFFSKDKILEIFLINNFNKIIFLFLFFSIGLTVRYSIRLMYYSFIIICSKNIYFKFLRLSRIIFYSILILFFISIFIGFLLNWIIFAIKNLIFLNKKLKLIIYLFIIIGLIIGLILIFFNFSYKYLFFFNNYIFFIINIWFLFIIYNLKIFNFIQFFHLKFYLVDLKWNEYLISFSILQYLKKILYLELINKNFFYLIIFIFYLVLFIIIFYLNSLS